MHRHTFTLLIAVFFSGLTLLTVQAARYADIHDESSITLTGTVEKLKESNFLLNYGNGHIRVENGTDDYRLYTKYGRGALKEGEQVTVSGRVDDDLFDNKEITAHTLIRRNGATMVSSLPDFEGNSGTRYTVPEEGEVVVSGRVNRVKGDSAFVLDYGQGTITVGAKTLAPSPLGEHWREKWGDKLRQGDQVRITGWIGNDLFKKREMTAQEISRVNVAERE